MRITNERRLVYRVYLVYPAEIGGWADFGKDYPDHASAARVARQWQKAWPNRRYVARGVWLKVPAPIVTGRKSG